MSMMNGFALCAEVEYEHTYLDRIKIGNQNQMDNGRPVHLDKLFENEEQFLDDPMEEVAPLKRSRKPSFSSQIKSESKKNRQKLKR